MAAAGQRAAATRVQAHLFLLQVPEQHWLLRVQPEPDSLQVESAGGGGGGRGEAGGGVGFVPVLASSAMAYALSRFIMPPAMDDHFPLSIPDCTSARLICAAVSVGNTFHRARAPPRCMHGGGCRAGSRSAQAAAAHHVCLECLPCAHLRRRASPCWFPSNKRRRCRSCSQTSRCWPPAPQSQPVRWRHAAEAVGCAAPGSCRRGTQAHRHTRTSLP